jgi:hypothetical protein
MELVESRLVLLPLTGEAMMVLRRTAGLGGKRFGRHKPMKCFFLLLYAPLLVLTIYHGPPRCCCDSSCYGPVPPSVV